jgi:hypothetical protein
MQNDDEAIKSILDKWPDESPGSVFECRRHGQRTESQCYRTKDKSSNYGFRYKCKECVYMNAFNRPCTIHGDIPKEDRLSTGQCRLCNMKKMHEMNDRRNNNRTEFNDRERLKREANHEKYKIQYKEKYQRDVKKHGADYLNDVSKANIRGLTVEEYRQMFIDQNDLCKICNQPESRIYKYKDESKGIKISKLCLDHNHLTGKVRDLLCHDCNTMIGKAKENIQILQSAISYLNRHE